MPNAVLASQNTTLLDLHASRGCSCRYWGCRPIPDHVNRLMTRAIWERLTRRIDHTPLDPHSSQEDLLLERCVDVFLPSLRLINEALRGIKDKAECNRFGCPFLPLNVSTDFMARTDTLCVPLSFNPDGADPVYFNLTLRSQRPLTMPEGLLVKGGGRSVYLVRNGSLHEFPNGDTFLGMGYDWGDIVGISDNKLRLMVMGEPIPSLTV